MTLLDFLKVLRKRWVTVVLLTQLGIVVAAGISALLPKQYEAAATSFVTITTNGSDPTAVYQSSQFALQRVKSYTLLIDSPQVLDAVIDDLGLDTTAQKLSGKVSLENPLDTTILTVRATDTDPERAAAIANGTSAQLSSVIESLETPRSDVESPVKVTLTTPAPTPESPVSPKLPINLTLGLLLGLAAGITVALARHYLDTTLRSQEAVLALTGQLPLAAVPTDPGARRRSPLALDPTSPLLESFRTLRSNLRFSNVDDPPRTMVVCSAISSEGKSTTAQNLAIALAQSGFGVCLLDADLRRPSIAKNLGIDGTIGLTNVLIGESQLDEALVSWHRGLLQVLPAGTIPSDPPTLLGSEHMRALLGELRERFEYVIIDAPPILHVSDAAVLADVTDGALLVIRAGRSRRDQVQASLEALRTVGARLLGTVLTFAPSSGRYDYGSSVTLEDSVRDRLDDTPAGDRLGGAPRSLPSPAGGLSPERSETTDIEERTGRPKPGEESDSARKAAEPVGTGRRDPAGGGAPDTRGSNGGAPSGGTASPSPAQKAGGAQSGGSGGRDNQQDGSQKKRGNPGG
ncbi:MAG: polysaccharide biosynthesis tyrosine autokinase [Nocardioides sp.]|nr:polysaccharide biosynthesis tyrosine autokinase [Nocardioides sp.]